jgi:hypothetical protein
MVTMGILPYQGKNHHCRVGNRTRDLIHLMNTSDNIPVGRVVRGCGWWERQGTKAEYDSSNTAEVKNDWSLTSNAPLLS